MKRVNKVMNRYEDEYLKPDFSVITHREVIVDMD